MENDAISRSEALEVGNVRQVTEYDEAGYYMTYNAVPVNVIEELPALDVAPVVRCKDCKHWKPCEVKGFEGHKYCEWAGWLVGENGYCVYGEVKEHE